MIVGTEWLIEAFECDAEKLRSIETLRAIFTLIIDDLGLKTVGEANWHKFGGEGGVTGLSDADRITSRVSYLPRTYNTATFNLYCCKTRPEWNWEERLSEMLERTRHINIQKIERGNPKSIICRR